MGDSFTVGFVQAECYLLEQVEGLVNGETSLLFERLGQRCASDVGCDEVGVPVLLTKVVGGEDMRVLEFDQRSGFPGKEGGILIAQWPIIRIVENRDHYWLFLRFVPGKVYR